MLRAVYTSTAIAIVLMSLAQLPARAQEAEPLADDVFDIRFLVGMDGEYERNFDLDDDERSDVQGYELMLRTSLTYRPNEWLRAFLETEAKLNLEREQGERDDFDPSLDITQAYLAFEDVLISDSELLVGRFLKRDHREWLFDENLDGLRFTYEPDGMMLDFSVSRVNLVQRDLLDSDSIGDPINTVALLADFEISDDLWIGGYGVVRDDRSREREEGRPIHFGLRSHGELVDNLSHWLDLAAVRGSDGEEPLAGYAFTAGATYRFAELPATPRLTLGYAWASGDDDPDDGRNREFRQTGLQSNEGRFGESAKFKYYGEAFDPELSNMSVLSAGIGFNPTEKLSLDLVYHRYWQNVASDRIRDAAFDLSPNQGGGGFSRDLGQELDLVIGYEPNEAWEIELAAGYFWPGDAYRVEQADGSFRRADPALFARVEVEFRF